MANIDIGSLQSFSAADLLKMTEYRIAQILSGAQAYDVNGRKLTHADLAVLREQRMQLQAEVAEGNAGQSGGGNVLYIHGHEV